MRAYPLHAIFFNYLARLKATRPVTAIPNTMKAISRSHGHCSARRSLTTWAQVPLGSSFVPVTREYSRIASSASRKVWMACP